MNRSDRLTHLALALDMDDESELFDGSYAVDTVIARRLLGEIGLDGSCLASASSYSTEHLASLCHSE
jgi:hypothetical protein